MKNFLTSFVATLLFFNLLTAQLPSYVPINGLVGYWSFTGNVNDVTGHGHNGTVNGATLSTDRFGNPNSAYYFDNTGTNFIDIPSDVAFNSQTYSIVFWYKFSTPGTSINGGPNVNPALISRLPAFSSCVLNQCYDNWVVYEINSGMDFNTGGGGFSLIPPTQNDGQWRQIAVCVASDSIRGYSNGVLKYTHATGTSLTFGNYPIRIGRSNATYWKAYNGNIDDLAIYNRALTQQEITSLYSGSCNGADITTGLVASYPFTGNPNDATGNGYNGLVTGATLTTDRFGNANNAYYFNGSAKIQLGSFQFQPYVTTGFSISYWFTMNDSTSSNRHMILSNYDGVNGVQIEADTQAQTGLRHSLRTNPTQIDNYYPITSNYSQWKHGVLVWSPPNMISYVNDVQVNTQTSTAITNLSVCCGINTNLGTEGNNIQWGHLGKIDDVRIYNRPLTACDIDSLFHLANQCTGVTASITPQGNTTFCAGGSVVLNASTGSSYAWNNSATTQNITATQTNTYTVTVTNANGCTASASQSVTVNPNPATPTITPSGATTFCQGGSVSLSSSSSNGYSWSTSATSQSITVSQTGTYTVTVSNVNNCTASASQSVTVNPNPATPTITPSGATTFCQGGSVTLSSSSANGYSWSNSSTSQSITVSQTGNYTVTISNANNCTASASQTVTVNPLPTVTINPLPAFVNNNASSITLTGSPAGGTYSGAGVTGTTFNPSTAGLGSKQITHSYTDGNGCSNSASTTTIVYDTTGIVCTAFDTVTTHITVHDTTHVILSTTDTLVINVVLTGIAPPNNTNTVFVFPNPTHDHITIDNGNFSSMSGYSVKITNVLGQIVFNQPITVQQFSIDLNTWGGPGTYILYVLDGSQAIKATKQIVLQ